MEQIKTLSKTIVRGDINPDPITGEPGAHPVGVGAGAAGGGIAGAVVGAAIGGPIGAGVGAVVGVVSGGLAGKSAAEAIKPTAEHEFWRTQFQGRPYFTHGTPYEQYGPAFQFGWQSYAAHPDKTFNDIEPQLARDWESRRGQSQLSWKHAKGATYDAWHRAEQAACSSCGSM